MRDRISDRRRGRALYELFTRRGAGLALCACLLAAAPLRAAVLFEIESDGAPLASIWLRDDSVAMEDVHAGGEPSGMRYDAAGQRLRVLLHARREYVDIDPERLDRARQSVQGMAQVLGEQSQQMMQMLRKQLQAQGMSEAQIERALGQVERFATPADEAAPRAATSVEDTGERSEVAGFACRVFELRRGDSGEGRACLAEPGELGLSAGEARTLGEFFAFMQRMSSAAGGVDEADALFSGGIGGRVPLELRDATGRLLSRVRAVQRREPPPGTFATPQDYQPGQMMPF